MRHRKRSPVAMALVLLALVLLVGIVVVPAIADKIVAHKYLPQEAFDSTKWRSFDEGTNSPVRRGMIRDLVTNVLPHKSKDQIEMLLGPSASHEQMRRHSEADFQVRERDKQGNWKPFPRTGIGYYFDEYEWDLIYEIGKEQILVFDHNGQEFSPDPEYLMIRLNDSEEFESWYIFGSARWPKVVGPESMKFFRETRRGHRVLTKR